MMVRICAALAQEKSAAPTRALMASTVRSSTMAFTWAKREPMRVRIKVMTTSHLYGFT